MDPTQTLKDAREAVKLLRNTRRDADERFDEQAVMQLADAFAALDVSLSAGGPLPAPWQEKR